MVRPKHLSGRGDGVQSRYGISNLSSLGKTKAVLAERADGWFLSPATVGACPDSERQANSRADEGSGCGS